jgi:DNA-binding transcriptional LysR family regulator
MDQLNPHLKLPSFAALSYMEAACRLGSVTSAARELGVSHAAVSQAITGLETRFGQLLDRRGKGDLHPTPAAKALIAGYLRATNTLAHSVASAEADPGQTCFRIRVDPAFANGWLSHHVAALLAEFPNVVIGPREAQGSEDLAISRSDLSQQFSASTELFRDALMPVCAPRLLENLRLNSPGDLAQVPLICGDAGYWRDWFASAGVDPTVNVRTIILSEQSLRIRAAIQGLGVTLVNPVFALPEIESGALAIAYPAVLPRPVPYRAYWRREDEHLSEIRRLVGWFHKVTREAFPSLAAARACQPVLASGAEAA